MKRNMLMFLKNVLMFSKNINMFSPFLHSAQNEGCLSVCNGTAYSFAIFRHVW